MKDTIEFIKEHLPTIIAFATVFAYWLLELIYKRITKKNNLVMRDFIVARNKDTDLNTNNAKEFLQRLVDEKNSSMDKARKELIAEKDRLTKENADMKIEIENLKTACKLGFSNTNDLVKTGIARNINRIIDKTEISESEGEE